jgi:hypothetical protein
MFDHSKTLKLAAALLLFVFLLESPAPARGQGIGVYRGRQGRRVGRVTLPTPPFNPNAGILNGDGRRGRDSAKNRSRRKAVGNVKASNRNPTPRTPRRRRARRHRTSH